MLDVNNLQLTQDVTESGYVALTMIWNGKPNPELSESDQARCEYAIAKQATDSVNDRLSNNYEANLKLSNMFLYTVLWDPEADQPVQIAGAQMMGRAVRLYSRYYIFSDYRVRGHGNLNTTDKLADFDLLRLHLKISEHFFDYVFISRDKGVKAFHRLKRSRPDVFSDWYVIPDQVELCYPGNFQGCMVRGECDITGFTDSVRPD